MKTSPAKTPKGPDHPQQQLYGTAARNASLVREPDPEMHQRHLDSKSKYPKLALSSEEYVIEEVRRHPIGLVSIWAIVTFIILVMMAGLSIYSANVGSIMNFFASGTTTGVAPHLPSAVDLLPFVAGLSVLFILGGVVATVVYLGNEFFVTNEAIFQFVQTSLFDTKTQVVNLINVEDVSQDQRGIIQQLLNYGTLRVSTQGEETTYHFYFVSNPARIVNLVNDCSEKAVLKMQGVPVTEH